jgi:hypothetical protein
VRGLVYVCVKDIEGEVLYIYICVLRVLSERSCIYVC